MFNRYIYREGLRCNRIPVVLTAALTLVVSLLTAVAVKPTVTVLKYAGIVTSVTENTSNVAVLAYPLYALWLAAPLLVFLTFGFLFRRNECDFYHAVGVGRSTLFLSLTAAVVTAVVGIFALHLALDGILYAVWFRAFDFLPLLREFGFALGYTLALTGWALLACAVANTRGTAILLFSSFLLTVFAFYPSFYFAFSFFPCLSYEEPLIRFFNYEYHFPMALYTRLCGVNETEMALLLRNACLSAGISAGLAVIAGAVFCKKDSALAGNPLGGKIVPHAVRTSLVSVPLVCWGYFLTAEAESVFFGGWYQHFDYGVHALFLAVSLLAWFLYEFIVTKKMRKAVQSARYLWIPAALLFLFVGVTCAFGFGLYHPLPEKSQVQSITLKLDSGKGTGICLADLFRPSGYWNELVFEGEEQFSFLYEALQHEMESASNTDCKYNVTVAAKDGTVYRYGVEMIDTENAAFFANPKPADEIKDLSKYRNFRLGNWLLDGQTYFDLYWNPEWEDAVEETFRQEFTAMSAAEIVHIRERKFYGSDENGETTFSQFCFSIDMEREFNAKDGVFCEIIFYVTEENFPETYRTIETVLENNGIDPAQVYEEVMSAKPNTKYK